MRTFSPQVLFQEVPDHISLGFTVYGCPFRCEGCHSQDTWNRKAGVPLCDDTYQEYLNSYQSFINCVVFFGGEWHQKQLISKLKLAQQLKLKTCLYTGALKVSQNILNHLNFLKTGPWIKQLGGLDSPFTNQRFVDLDNNKILNYKFLGEHSNVVIGENSYRPKATVY